MCNFNNETNSNAMKIWTFLSKCDIIDTDTEELLELINMTKQEKKEQAILKEHIENLSLIHI